LTTRYVLAPPPPYQGSSRCPRCAGARVTGERYVFDRADPFLLVDVICPGCGGCGRNQHDGCQPSEHADWEPDCDDDDDGDGAFGVCASCHGRTWWACQGFTDRDIHHLRVPCGCAKDMLIPVED
jgi:hypothetical protein